MEQNPSQSNPQNPLKPHHQSPPHHLLRRDYREFNLNNQNNQKLQRTHTKAFQAIKTEAGRQRNPSLQFLKTFMKNSAAQGSLTKFSSSFSRPLSFENAHLFSRLKYLSALDSLELDFQTTERFGSFFDVLYRNLPDLKNLTHFKMSITFDFFTNSKFLQRVFRCLQHLNNLTNLSLNLQSKYPLEPGKLKDLPCYLKRLKQIHSLELIFGRFLGLTAEDILIITSVLPKLPLLTQIGLNFEVGNSIKGSTLVKIFNNMRALLAIKINLEDCSVIQYKGACSLTEGLKLLNASSLQKLDLHLPRNLDCESFLKISHVLKEFTSLSFLRLNALGCFPLSNQTMESICSALESLKSLRSLSLTIPFSYTCDFIIGNIASVFKSLQNLIQLKLNFPQDLKTSRDQLVQLFSSIGILTSLQSLEISLENPEELSDHCLQALSQSLQRLLLLKNLALNFNCACFITSVGVSTLANSLKELQNLTFLGLTIRYSPEVDEMAIEKIAEALYWLPLLYSASFDFAECHRLKEQREGFVSLWNALGEMKNIHKVSLDTLTIGVNEKEVNDLKKRKIVRSIEFW